MANTIFSQSTPSGTDVRSEGDDRIRELKTALRSALDTGKLLPDDLAVFNNATTPNSKVDVSASGLLVSDGSAVAYVLDTVSVTADIAVSGANGLDTGVEAASTLYFVWVIWNATSSTIAALLSTSATAPTMPAGYSYKKRVGSVFNNSASNFEGAVQDGSWVRVLDNKVQVADVVNTTTETDLYSFSVPGNTLRTTRTLRLRIVGDYLNDSGAGQTVRIRMYYGATLLFDATSPSISTGPTRRMMFLEAELMAKGATNAQAAWGFAWIGNNGVAGGTNDIGGSGLNLNHAGGHNAVAIDSTAAQNLRVSATHSVANASLSARSLSARLELIQ